MSSVQYGLLQDWEWIVLGDNNRVSEIPLDNVDVNKIKPQHQAQLTTQQLSYDSGTGPNIAKVSDLSNVDPLNGASAIKQKWNRNIDLSNLDDNWPGCRVNKEGILTSGSRQIDLTKTTTSPTITPLNVGGFALSGTGTIENALGASGSKIELNGGQVVWNNDNTANIDKGVTFTLSDGTSITSQSDNTKLKVNAHYDPHWNGRPEYEGIYIAAQRITFAGAQGEGTTKTTQGTIKVKASNGFAGSDFVIATANDVRYNVNFGEATVNQYGQDMKFKNGKYYICNPASNKCSSTYTSTTRTNVHDGTGVPRIIIDNKKVESINVNLTKK
jgi:hypothetical protein